MKTSIIRQEYQRLELISESQSTKAPKAADQLRNIWRSLLAYFASGNELRVWKATDAAGQPVWRAYDPLTQRRAEFDCELDLRVWVEERYSYSPVQPSLLELVR